MCMKESKNDIFGISEAFNHALEWRSRGADSMIQRNVSPALRATDYKCPKYVWYKSNETNMADQNAIELPSELKGKKFRIRKLTPRECFRLMGVDDKDIDKIQASGISNSAQYKLAGNSIVVSCLYHIIDSLLFPPEGPQADKHGQLSLF